MSTYSGSVFVRLCVLAISQWRSSLFLGICMIILGFLFYQVWLHPTADIPGPFLNKLSNYVIMRHAERGTIHTYLFELHTKYGEIVRYAPNMVSYQKSEAFQDIYGFKKNATKPEDYYGTLREVSVNKHAFNTFNSTSVAQHARKRRIISHAFSDAAIRAYEPIVVKSVGVFLRKLQSQEKNLKQKPFDMAIEFNCLTLDIIGELCMGQSFGFMEGRGDEVIRESRPRAVNVYVNAHMPILKRIGLSKWIFPYYNKGTAFFMKWGGTVLRERVAKFESSKGAPSDEPRDILQYLLEAEDTETTSKYTPAELLGEAIGLLLGGSDTTSFNMAATVFYLASNPEKLDKLREEITTTFPSYHDITGGRVVANCRYLRACFDEALRLSPSVSLCLPRRVGKGGLKAAGRFFPEGVVVGVPHWAIFRDEKYFDDPHAFKPERWLGDKEDPKLIKMREAFQPFSVGSRNCVGKPLALNEVPYIISKLVYAFDFDMTSDYGKMDYSVTGCNEPLFYQEELLVPVGRGPEMRFRKRIDDDL